MTPAERLSRSALFLLPLLLAGATSSTLKPTRILGFEDRIRAQEAVERVYYSHQLSATRPFEEAVPRKVLEKKVRTYLAQSVALQEIFNTPVTADMLRREMERQALSTRIPERLRELHGALGDDPFLIQECLARPALVDRLVRDAFAHESQNGGSWDAWWRQVEGRLASSPFKAIVDGTEPLPILEAGPTVNAIVQPGFVETSSAQQSASAPACSLNETWLDMSLSNAPIGRDEQGEVWTGSLVIVWGGAAGGTRLNTGGRYDPATDTWTETTVLGAPSPRNGLTAVWTGDRMVVWGGLDGSSYFNSGGQYDPTHDTWTPTSTAGAPAPRYAHTAVWTGQEMIVWGGRPLAGSPSTGGRYDPAHDSWIPMAPPGFVVGGYLQSAVWTGTEMIVWGGLNAGYLNTGGIFTPATDSWRSTSTTGAPAGRDAHSAVWAQSVGRMIVWGGFRASPDTDFNTGGQYDPIHNTWSPTSTVSAPAPRALHTAVWTGDSMIAWGGTASNGGTSLGTGGRYDPNSDSWTPTSTTNAPLPRYNHRAVWTGASMLVWGGQDSAGAHFDSGSFYYPGASPEGPPGDPSCSDSVDNDCDGLIDTMDPDCQTPEICDGRDNDGDNLVDEDFPNLGAPCAAGTGACLRSGVFVCSANGASTVCDANPGSSSPEGPAGDPTCSDGVDNDCDGFTDAADGDCSASLEVIDPDCSSDTDCKGEYLIGRASTGQIRVNDFDPTALALAPVSRRGVATDGTALLLLRIRSDDTVTFKLRDPSGAPASSQWGFLSETDPMAHGNEVTVTPVSTSQGNYAFAVFLPPERFPGTGAQVAGGVAVTVAATSAGAAGTSQITLIPPPTLLVHGVWANVDAWTQPNGGLEKYLTSRGFRICKGCLVQYGGDSGWSDSAPSFDPAASDPADQVAVQSLIESTKLALESYRQDGFAAAQANVIGHSLGGLVARSRVKSAWSPYLRRSNYGKGDFNKIITIGTPNWGTPLADWLLQHKCEIVNSTVSGVLGQPTIEEFFDSLNKPLGPAIYGFQTTSPVLDRIGSTPVPSHSIVGVEPAFGSLTEFILNLVPRLAGHFFTTVDGLLGGDGNHDTIVPLDSQGSFLAVNSSVSLIPEVVHTDISTLDTGETESSAVWTRVEELLLASDSFPLFDHKFSFALSGNPLTYPSPCPVAAPLSPSSTALGGTALATVTMTPAPGTIVGPRESLNVSFEIDGGNNVDGALFLLDRNLDAIEGPGPFSLTWTVPTDVAGRLELTARSFGPGPDNYEASTYVIVQPASSLASIDVVPTSVSLSDIGHRAQLRVTGRYADGTELSLSSPAAGTSYATMSGGEGVISLTSNGLIEAKAAGVDSVVVTNSGISVIVPVSVAITNHAPDIAPLPDLSLAAGDSLTLALIAVDSDGDSIEISSLNLPAFASVVDFGGGLGELRLTPGLADEGAYSVAAVASDSGVPPLGDGSWLKVTVGPCVPAVETCDGRDNDCDGIVDNPIRADRDGDGLDDGCDNCSSTANTGQADTDNDGFGDACDNCPAQYNPTQADADHDGLGDACDRESCSDGLDNDGDGLVDGMDPDCRPLLVNLTGFEATAGQGIITLRWATASELNTAGFLILRGTSQQGPYFPLTPQILPSRGGPAAGTAYMYEDRSARKKKTYYYLLVDLDLEGRQTRHGPVSASLRPAATARRRR